MDIREISAHLAMRVIQQAIEEGLDVSVIIILLLGYLNSTNL